MRYSRKEVTLRATSFSLDLTCDEVRERIGISDGLVRISVGIEDVGDLIKDLDQALSRC